MLKINPLNQESNVQINMLNASLDFNLNIQVTIDLENYISMSFDLTPHYDSNSQLIDVSTSIIDQVSANLPF